MVKLFFYLAILIGVGYAAQRVPIGDKTALQHLRENVSWESVRERGEEAVAAVRSFVAEEPASVAASEGPSGAPVTATAAAKSESATANPRSDEGNRAPAERLTAADRRALEELLPH